MQSSPPPEEEEQTVCVDSAVKRAPPKGPTASILRGHGRDRSKAASAASSIANRRAEEPSMRSPSQRIGERTVRARWFACFKP